MECKRLITNVVINSSGLCSRNDKLEACHSCSCYDLNPRIRLNPPRELSLYDKTRELAEKIRERQTWEKSSGKMEARKVEWPLEKDKEEVGTLGG